MLSNYPPRVTGNELQIAGPDKELDTDAKCPYCGASMTIPCYGGSRWLQCTEGDCDTITLSDDDDPLAIVAEIRESIADAAKPEAWYQEQVRKRQERVDTK